MINKNKSWFGAPQVTLRFTAFACFLWSGLVFLCNSGGVGEYLVTKLARPLEFKVREWVGESPSLSPKLKIFAVDDSTFGQLGTWVLTPKDWIDVLTAIAKKSPRGIFIDQIFSKGVDFIPGSSDSFSESLKKLGVPVYVGAFLSPGKLKFRDELSLDGRDFDLDSWLGPDSGDGRVHDLPTLPHGHGLIPYGPSLQVKSAFSGIGHLMYDGSGTVSPLIILNGKQVFPHVSALLSRDRRVRLGRLELDGHVVPLDEAGRQIINFPSFKELRSRSHSLRGLYVKAQAGGQSDLVERDDVVLILPHMYTGNTDFKQTPIGSIPAGWIIASQLSSFLEKKWLKPVTGELFFSFVLAGIGASLGATLGVGSFWLSLNLGLLLIVGASLGAFAYFSLVLPWLLPTISYLGAALTVYMVKALAVERKTRILRQALEGVVPDADLKEVLRHPQRVSLEPRERIVTVMFVDVVGFSLVAERMLPRHAFENLKSMLANVSQIVHEFGGAIDKTLGDGLLCYFGYRFDQDATTPDHAERALFCARKIQELNVRRNILAAQNKEPVYPLRIGINTSSCYLGDLGSENRIDFTLVGNGVNFAKRLEGACEMHSVLLGSTTYDLVRVLNLEERFFRKRLIQIKHHNELVEAFEFDPFADQPELRAEAILGFRQCISIDRTELRRPVSSSLKIRVTSDQGQGLLVNFSQRGMAIRLPQFLAKGIKMTISLDSPSGGLKKTLEEAGLGTLVGEVRWGYADEDQYVHGIWLEHESEQRGKEFLKILMEYIYIGHETARKEQLGGGGPHVA